MPKIKFTVTPELPFDIAHLAYKVGDVVDMPEDSARRWIRRGVAEYYKGANVAPSDVDKTVAAFTEAVYAVEDSILYGSDDPRTPAGLLNSHPVDEYLPAETVAESVVEPSPETAPAEEVADDKPKRGRRPRAD